MLTITKSQARRFLINHHQLNRKIANTDENIMSLFTTLGCIQYDPLNVVGRNPDLVLQARIENYSSLNLYSLLYDKHQLIDGWDKMMAIYPTNNWSYFNRIRQQHGKGTKNTLEYRKSSKALKLTNDLIEHIKDKGPVQSSKLASESTNKGPWGHKNLTSAALDYLCAKGDICVHSKMNTQKVYDLTSNIVPNEILEVNEPFTDDEAFVTWYIIRRIKGMGLVWNKSGGTWLGYYLQQKRNRTPIIKKLLASNIITQLCIEDIKEPFYIFTEYLKKLYIKESEIIPSFIRFLAPLDNLIWDRDMIETIFNFNYRWEVYTPVVKRQFGYYVLPILYNYQLVGRIEFDYYRGETNLSIKNIWYEPSFTPDEAFNNTLELELAAFHNYLRNSM